MENGVRPLVRGVIPVLAGVVAAGLVVAAPPARADDPAPSTPNVPGVVQPGQTVSGPPVSVATPSVPIAGSLPVGNVPGVGPAGPPVEVKNGMPKVKNVAAYTLDDVPGTFSYKIAFEPVNGIREQRVLAADSNGAALDPSRVRLAFLTTGNQYWVFYPASGKLDSVGAWPTVYPGAVRGVAVHPLTDLFGGPGGEKWLETARQIAVAICAAVVLVGALVVVAPAAFAAGAASVPLAW